MIQPRILVVEDEAGVDTHLEQRLTALGYQVTGTASSVEQAIAMVRDRRPDLVLLAIRFDGDTDAIGAGEQIRNRFHVPAIFLGAFCEGSTPEQAKGAECQGFPQKPFDDRELKSAIEIALYKYRTDEELLRMGRLYNVLSQVSQAVVCAESREELLDTVCRLVVENGAVDLAWIGRPQPGQSHMHPVASFGKRSQFLADVEYGGGITIHEQQEGLGGWPVFEGVTTIGNDCVKTPGPCPLGQSFDSYGFQSCASFPLWFKGNVFGALNICVETPGFFREKEIKLLEEVAAAISFALDKIEGDIRRKDTEELLRESEERYRLAMEATNDGLWDWDLLTGDVYFSPAYFRMLGYEPGQFPGKAGTWIDLIHPEDREHVLAVNEACIRNRLPAFSVEFRMRSSEGDWRWILGRGKAVRRDADGLALQMIGTHVDITEQKHKEKELEQLYRQNERILNAAGEGIVVLDQSGRTTFANPAAIEMLGYEPGELTGACFHDLVHHHKSDGSPGLLEECPTYSTLENGRTVCLPDEIFWRKDGAAFPASYSATPIIEDGVILGAVVTFRDITLRKKALDALRESEEEFKTMFEMASIGITQTDPNTRRWVRVNPKMCEITGYSCEELLQKHVYELTHPDDLDHDKEEFENLISGKSEVIHVEKRYIRKNGETIWLNINGTLIRDAAGRPIRTVATIEDITERKRMEREQALVMAQLQQAQKLEALGTLAGGVAHDFNNILSIIIGYAELATMDTEAGSRIAKKLQQILNAGSRAKELVTQILAFSRRSEHQKISLQLHLIIKEAMKMLRPSLPSTIEIKTEVSSTSAVLADPTQMHQVLMNLCTNAAHAMRDKGGVLEVGLHDIVVATGDIPTSNGLQPGRYVELSVKDSGHGIDQGIIDFIFDPFFTTKKMGEGTGLGLSVVHGILKSHGGTIAVRSVPGKETVFSVLIPAIETADELKEAEIAVPFSRGNERILVVDDEPALAEMTRTMLSTLGYEAISCTSGLEALEILKNEQAGMSFDLVLTDMTMPRLTGEELIHELSSLRPEIPVILMTGFSEKIDAEKAKALGIKGFLLKPVNLKELAAMIRKVVEEANQQKKPG